jgi:trypsin
MNVERAIPHENYDPNTLDNDIGILILSSPIPEGKNAKSIKISKEKNLKPGSTVTVSGWGFVTLTPNPLSVLYLKIAHLNVVQRSICRDLWAQYTLPLAITDNMICAIDATNSACHVSITK